MDFFDVRSVPLWTAFFAGVVSMVSLIIAKEHRVSDFRQAWINALRGEIASLIGRVNAINEWRLATSQRSIGDSGSDGTREGAVDDIAERYKLVHPDVLKMEEALATIKLRLNPKEDKAEPLIKKAEAVVHEVRLDEALCRERLRCVEEDFLHESKTYLKEEWERVKKGEPWYRRAVWITGGMTAVGFGLFLLGLASWLWEGMEITMVGKSAARVEGAPTRGLEVAPKGIGSAASAESHPTLAVGEEIPAAGEAAPASDTQAKAAEEKSLPRLVTGKARVAPEDP